MIKYKCLIISDENLGKYKINLDWQEEKTGDWKFTDPISCNLKMACEIAIRFLERQINEK